MNGLHLVVKVVAEDRQRRDPGSFLSDYVGDLPQVPRALLRMKRRPVGVLGEVHDVGVRGVLLHSVAGPSGDVTARPRILSVPFDELARDIRQEEVRRVEHREIRAQSELVKKVVRLLPLREEVVEDVLLEERFLRQFTKRGFP